MYIDKIESLKAQESINPNGKGSFYKKFYSTILDFEYSK